MGEVSYVWADPNSPVEQVALSALVRAMESCSEDPTKIKDDGTPIHHTHFTSLHVLDRVDADIDEKTGKKRKPKKFKYCAVARLVTADGRDPRMGVLWPMRFPEVDCLLWVPVRTLLLPIHFYSIVALA